MTRFAAAVAEDLRVLSPDAPMSLWRALLTKRHFRPIYTYRLANAACALRGPLGPLLRLVAKLLHRRCCAALCMELPVTCRIGPGLRIFHGYGLVLHGGVQLGHHVTLKHHTTLGATEKGVPTIGNHVEIGVHCVVVGPVLVGDHAVVGAGSVITKNVDHGTTVAGTGSQVRVLAHRPTESTDEG